MRMRSLLVAVAVEKDRSDAHGNSRLHRAEGLRKLGGRESVMEAPHRRFARSPFRRRERSEREGCEVSFDQSASGGRNSS